MIIHGIAESRNYREVGIPEVITLINGTFSLSNKTATTARDILYRLARPPYEWIKTSPDAAQLIITPISKVAEIESG